jgi:hypothetical protein
MDEDLFADPLLNPAKSNNASKASGGKNPTDYDSIFDESAVPLDMSTETQLSWKNYAKESFSPPMSRPFSRYSWKIIKGISFAITGLAIGAICSILICFILLQFGSVENTVLSSAIEKHFENIMPDNDLSIKTASFQWNSEHKAFEINLKKVRIDDFIIPNIAIIPDYLESLRQQRIVAKSVALINTKMKINITDNLNSVALSIGTDKGADRAVVFKPVSELAELKKILDKDVLVSFVNSDVVITEVQE